MNEQKIYLVAKIVRKVFENIRNKNDIPEEFAKVILTLPEKVIRRSKIIKYNAFFRLNVFPKGCCADAAHTLGSIFQKYALELGIVDNIECVVANFCNGKNHKWIRCGVLNVDITLDQINDECNTNYPGVYVQNNHPLSEYIVCKEKICKLQEFNFANYIAQRYLEDIFEDDSHQ